MPKNIFIVGLDDFNLERLRNIRHAERYRFHRLLELGKLKSFESLSIRDELNGAAEKLRSFDGSIDAIIGFWDFPVSIMVPILANQFGTISPSLESVVKCEHKYWSRLEQSRVIGEHVPEFTAVNPIDDNPLSQIDLDYPFWLKPVKAYASKLGFKVENEDQFWKAIREVRGSIRQFADPFNYVLSLVDLPEEVKPVDGTHCVAEGIIDGHQCTLAGYVHQGEVQTYGLISSINYPGSSSFYRYQYPSKLPEEVKKRMSVIGKRVMAHVGFDNSPFNIEFFYHEETDRIWLLEINTRISQSHSYLFEKVDGSSNHQVLVELALDRIPDFPRNDGDFKCAAKFHLRAFEGEKITNVPGEEQFRRVHEELPYVEILAEAEQGTSLADVPGRDSYSARLAVIYVAAENEDKLIDKYRRCLDVLDYRVDGKKLRA